MRLCRRISKSSAVAVRHDFGITRKVLVALPSFNHKKPSVGSKPRYGSKSPSSLGSRGVVPS